MAIQEYFERINRWCFKKNALETSTLVSLLQLDAELIAGFENHLKLDFVAEKVMGNVCFASDSDVRAEFRTNFRAIDVVDYLSALLNELELPLETANFQYPTDTTVFWQKVMLGASLRKDI